ncbi:hypothetical protein ACFSGX_11325 [Sphingomonas arantia]|uniref:Uncharacterized protein n=2 Tax=Sphingomonas arantia TaxID=1460676 RepID=A0ABW4U005_9SPHN
MLTDATLLSRVEAYLEATGVRPSRFGLDVMGDGGLVAQLRAGRSLSLKNAVKVMLYIEANNASSGSFPVADATARITQMAAK